MLTTVQKIGPTLDLFDNDHPEWGVSEVAAALGMSKSSAHALLTSLDEIGLLQRTDQARYRLGWRLLTLSRTLLQTSTFRAHSTRTLRRAVDRWGQPMHLAAFDRGSVVYLECVRAPRSAPLPTTTGARLPAHPTALGKVLLSGRSGAAVERYAHGRLKRYTPNTIVTPERLLPELRQARDEGVAYDQQETIDGLCCVAAPVRSRTGAVVAAVSVSATARRFERHADAYTRLVRDVARELSIA